MPHVSVGARRVALGAAVLLAAGIVTGVVITRPGEPTPDRAAAVVAAPRPSVARSNRPVPKPRPAVPHDAVPAASPRRFTLSGPAFTIKARVCGMANERPLDPPGEQHHTVCWVRNDFGVAPGSRSATTYVLGHSWAPDPQEVLNQASARATRDVLRARPVRYDGVPVYPAPSLLGYHLTLSTPQGRLTYTVRKAYGVRKLKLGDIRTVMDDSVRNRVVLFTCAQRHGVDYNYNIVLEAFLTSSQRIATRA